MVGLEHERHNIKTNSYSLVTWNYCGNVCIPLLFNHNQWTLSLYGKFPLVPKPLKPLYFL